MRARFVASVVAAGSVIVAAGCGSGTGAAPEPAQTITQGRPTKQDRRRLADWGDRWSAELD